jgi:hypothetical protein
VDEALRFVERVGVPAGAMFFLLKYVLEELREIKRLAYKQSVTLATIAKTLDVEMASDPSTSLNKPPGGA